MTDREKEIYDSFNSPERIQERETQAFNEAMANVTTNALTEPMPAFELTNDTVIQGELVANSKGEMVAVDQGFDRVEVVPVVTGSEVAAVRDVERLSSKVTMDDVKETPDTGATREKPNVIPIPERSLESTPAPTIKK